MATPNSNADCALGCPKIVVCKRGAFGNSKPVKSTFSFSDSRGSFKEIDIDMFEGIGFQIIGHSIIFIGLSDNMVADFRNYHFD